ncbi:MAG: hypothetical protein HYV32_03285 [Candidatus Kerfeldbacteria bacterium]|nr:hypothetical protein [Candidatus Kerfeldbacteria bacterium]
MWKNIQRNKVRFIAANIYLLVCIFIYKKNNSDLFTALQACFWMVILLVPFYGKNSDILSIREELYKNRLNYFIICVLIGAVIVAYQINVEWQYYYLMIPITFVLSLFPPFKKKNEKWVLFKM